MHLGGSGSRIPRCTRSASCSRATYPSALDPPPGCPFQTRCPRKIGRICEEQAPPIRRFGSGHNIACHIAPEDLLRMEPVIVLGDKEAAD
jgi:peptide/nickel transport system ATP-binding protein